MEMPNIKKSINKNEFVSLLTCFGFLFILGIALLYAGLYYEENISTKNMINTFISSAICFLLCIGGMIVLKCRFRMLGAEICISDDGIEVNNKYGMFNISINDVLFVFVRGKRKYIIVFNKHHKTLLFMLHVYFDKREVQKILDIFKNNGIQIINNEEIISQKMKDLNIRHFGRNRLEDYIKKDSV